MSEPQPEGEIRQRRHTRLLALLAVGMFGFGFALVPLYGLLCQVAGIQQGGLGAAARPGASVTERLEGTAAAVAVSIMNGAHIVRVHDVKEMVRVVKVVDAIKRGAVTAV